MLCEVSSLCEETLPAAWEAKPLAARHWQSPSQPEGQSWAQTCGNLFSPSPEQLPSFAAHTQAFKPEGLAKQSEFFLSPRKSEDLEREMGGS